MKKVLLIILCLILISLSANAAQWVEIFEKQYVDMSSVEVSYNTNTTSFWVKRLRKDPKELFPLTNKPYWYSISRWQLDCSNKKERITAIAVYDLNEKLMYSDEVVPEWNTIFPDTYADGYYNYFCAIPKL